MRCVTHSCRSAGCPGFTLVELLVVTAVLALLAGLLLPVISVARDRAWRATCTSNLHQLALAFQHYLDDYDRTFPPNTQGQLRSTETIPLLWLWQIRPYLRGDGVLHCPADPIRNARRTLSDALPEEWNRADLPALSYGANWDLMVAAAQGQPEARVDDLPYPAQTLMVADCSEPWAFGPVYTSRGVRWSHIAYANGLPVDGGGNVAHGGRSGMGHERHGTGSHVAFLDGHVALLPADRFENVMRAEPRHLVQVQRPIIWPAAVPPEEVKE